MNLFEREKLIRKLPDGDFTRIAVKNAEEISEEWDDNSSWNEDNQSYIYNLNTPAQIIKYLNDKKLSMIYGYALKRLVINKFMLDNDSVVDEIAKTFYKAFHDNNVPILDRNGERKPSTNDELKQIKSWLNQEKSDRNKFLRKISFALNMSDIQVSHFLRKELGEQDYNYRNLEEIIIFYCHYHSYGYDKYIELLEKHKCSINSNTKKDLNADYTTLFSNNYSDYFSDDQSLLKYLSENSNELNNIRQSTIEQFKTSWYKAIDKTNELISITENSEPIKEDEFYHTLCAHLPQHKGNKATVYSPKGSVLNSLVSSPLNKLRISQLLGKTDDDTSENGNSKESVNKKDLVTLEFYIFCVDREINLRKNREIDYYADYNRFVSETDDMLFENGFFKLYPGNRFDNLVMISLMNTECWGFFGTILEESFGYDYENDKYIKE